MLSHSVVSSTLGPYGLGRLLCPWGFSRQEYWRRLPFPPPGDLPNPGIEPRSSTLQVDSLPSEPPGNSMNTGVGSLSLLQGIFLTQESNWSLLHCRQILYELSYQGSCVTLKSVSFPLGLPLHLPNGTACPDLSRPGWRERLSRMQGPHLAGFDMCSVVW